MTPVLALTAAVAMALVVFRAWTQAITIDEASTYVFFVQDISPLHWLGSTNNHVLNSALMRLSTLLFGVSEISVRLPAMLGAGLYISACYRFCRRLEGGILLRWTALVCLIYSPFILDYLVAARGYSLALGFLMTALVAESKTLRDCIQISTAIGLCFASNFSFAFACAAVMVARFIGSWRESGIPRRRLVAAYVVPPLLVTWLLVAPALLNFPRAELWYGSRSLLDAFRSLLESQLSHRSAWLYLIPGLISLAWLVQSRKSLPATAQLFGGVFLATAVLHFAAFHLLGLLYPLDRTGIFFVPLLFGALASATTTPGGWLRRAQIGALLFVAALNLASLRLDHFEEWHFDADTNKIYSVLSCLHERQQVDQVAADWPYIAALNFYRKTSQKETFRVVSDDKSNPPAAEAFVLGWGLTPAVLPPRHLTAVWTSQKTAAMIAVPSEQAAGLQGSACFE